MNFHKLHYCDKLNGAVKTVEEKYYEIDDDGDLDLVWHTKSWINKQGLEMRLDWFDDCGRLNDRDIFEYDERGFMIKCTTILKSWNRTDEMTYQIEDNGLSVMSYLNGEFNEHTLYNENGDVLLNYCPEFGILMQYEYDKNYNVIKKSVQNGFNLITYLPDMIETYNYDSNNTLIETLKYDPRTGKLLDIEKNEHITGNLAVDELLNAAEGFHAKKRGYPVCMEADKYGNAILEIKTDFGGIITDRMERTYTYYKNKSI